MSRSLPDVTLSVLIAGSAVIASMVTGCSSPAADEASPPAAVPASSASVGSPDEPPGTIVCGKAVTAVRDASLMNPGVVADLADAAGTADAPVADAAQALSEAYTKAVAAHGTDFEPDAVAAVSAAAARLVQTCNDAGLETAG